MGYGEEGGGIGQERRGCGGMGLIVIELEGDCCEEQ